MTDRKPDCAANRKAWARRSPQSLRTQAQIQQCLALPVFLWTRLLTLFAAGSGVIGSLEVVLE